jgi:hypothetical protein
VKDSDYWSCQEGEDGVMNWRRRMIDVGYEDFL